MGNINQLEIQTGSPDNGHKYKAWEPHPYLDNYLFRSYIKKEDGSKYERWATKEDYDKIKEYRKKYGKKNRSKLNKKSKENYQKNKEYYLNYGKQWKKNNPEKCREYALKTYYKNPEPFKLIAMSNRFNNIKLNKEQKMEIREIYKKRENLQLCARGGGASTKYHVDHIMPLNHPNFCGLHAPWNLQILTLNENCRKRNQIDKSF